MSLKLLCLGDVMLGENLNHINRGIRTKFSNDFSKIIKPVVYAELTKDIDYIFYNFEYSLTPNQHAKSSNYKDVIYISEPKSIELFNNSIPKIVNIANNHFSQHGAETAQFTKSYLKQNDFIVIGETNKPVVIKDKGENIYFWGVSLIRDPNYCDEYFQSDYTKLIDEIKIHNKTKDEKWIISIHWGDEYITHPSEKQIQLAHKLVEFGFDLIIGHHPHVIQPTEIYKERPIIYSLGNFIFDQNFSIKTQKGSAVKLEISKKIIISSSYLTYQKKYLVYKIIIKTNNKHMLRKVFFYYLKLKISSLYSRVMMKIEVVVNFSEVDKLTIGYYRKKLVK